MAIPTQVLSDTELGKAFYSDLNSENIAEMKKGCTDCGNCSSVQLCLKRILFSLDYKFSKGAFDEVAQKLYYEMMEIIGGIAFTPTVLSVYAGADRSSPINLPQTFNATLQIGSYAIASILWTQTSGTAANLSGQTTLNLTVSNFPLGPSSYKITVIDIEGTTVESSVTLQGTAVVTSNAYYGTNNTGALPNLSQIVASNPVVYNIGSFITFPFGQNDYLFNFVAIPVGETIINHYQNVNVPTDNGNIGTLDDLFTAPVVVNGYNVYMGNYPVPLPDPLLLDRI